jgi:uncharacterized protein YecA (UPF0149 family)
MHETLKKHKVQVLVGNGKPFIARKIRPNDPCPCGSGKKAKHCCGTETRYYTPKDQNEQNQ